MSQKNNWPPLYSDILVSNMSRGVEEAVEDVIIIKSEFRTSAEAKSPKCLPRFLRSCFSRLVTKETAASMDSAKEEVVRPGSPATRQFVEENLARGLPLIPFHYTSLEFR